MTRLTRTSALGAVLSLLIAGQILFLSAPKANEVEFQSFEGTSLELEGLECVSKKLFFPQPSEKELPEGPSLIHKGEKPW